jgi:hypothetical protein
LRTFLIHRFISLGLDARELIARLQDPTTDVSERRALILSLGELSAGTRERLEPWLLESYEADPDAGYHSAVAWLLRHWKKEALLSKADARWRAQGPASDKHWYINRQGHVLVVVWGPVSYWMGSPVHEPDRGSGEVWHRAHIPYSFAIGATEVTNEQWQRFLRKRAQHRKHLFPGSRYSEALNEPPVALTWNLAIEYCQWLSEEEGLPKDQWCYPPLVQLLGLHEQNQPVPEPPDFLQRTGYRLPTEVEWEYCCRAGTVTSRSYGSDEEMLTNYAWYRGTIDHRGNTEKHVQAVGMLKPNDLGLFDMYGNAWEWCQDEDKQTPSSAGVPHRVLRGGAFDSRPENLRSAARLRAQHNEPTHMTGLRVARTLPRSEQTATKNERR